MKLLREIFMVDADNFKQKIRELISQKYEIKFLGDNFNKIVDSMNENNAEKIYFWINNVIARNIQPITLGAKAKYKDWTINQLLVFRHPFTLKNNKYRILFVKIKNSIYIEFHLGDHDYYDKIRKNLNIKQGNK